LLHKIEDDLNNNLQKLTKEKIQVYILEYDTIVENIDYTIPTFLKKRYIKIYKSTRILPKIRSLLFLNDYLPKKLYIHHFFCF